MLGCTSGIASTIVHGDGDPNIGALVPFVVILAFQILMVLFCCVIFPPPPENKNVEKSELDGSLPQPAEMSATTPSSPTRGWGRIRRATATGTFTTMRAQSQAGTEHGDYGSLDVALA